MAKRAPKVFLSYSHDSEQHKRWIRDLVKELKTQGIEVIWDEEHLRPGGRLSNFMIAEIKAADWVLAVCTETYVEKANAGRGGVGFEASILTKEVLDNINTRKILPVIRQSSGSAKMPDFFADRLYVNLSDESAVDSEFEKLVRTIKDLPLIDPHLHLAAWPMQSESASVPIIGIEMIRIKAGKFLMGSPDTEVGRQKSEGPLTEVTISHDFWIGKFPVTQEEYQTVMARNPSDFSHIGPSAPVECVTWDEASQFCRTTTELVTKVMILSDEYEFRLPTEAEWEYVCRSGRQAPFGIGDGFNVGSDLANFDGRYPYGNAAAGIFCEATTQVGKYPPNRWGVHDMHGNVFEWCCDGYQKRHVGEPVTDPIRGRSDGRVIRGGSWRLHGENCRAAARNILRNSKWANNVSFRVVLGAKAFPP